MLPAAEKKSELFLNRLYSTAPGSRSGIFSGVTPLRTRQCQHYVLKSHYCQEQHMTTAFYALSLQISVSVQIVHMIWSYSAQIWKTTNDTSDRIRVIMNYPEF